MVHQNAQYFERCQTADYDPSRTVETRHRCWTRWLAHYHEGQPPERIRHARDRIAALESGEETAPLPGMEGRPVGQAHTAAFLSAGKYERPAAEGTDSAETEPPSAEPTTTSERTEEPRIPSPPERRSSACTPVCEPGWEACVRACDDRGQPCIETCEVEYRTCLSGCH